MANGSLKKDIGGFTLVETFVAVTILALSVLGPLTIATRGLNATLIARDQLTATYLAQEVVEYVKYVKDTNALNGDSNWLEGLDQCDDGDGCQIDVQNLDEPVDCGSGGCDPLSLASSGAQIYAYSGGQATTFYRTLWVEDEINSVSLAPHERNIRVEVRWQTGTHFRSIVVNNLITNWTECLIRSCP